MNIGLICLTIVVLWVHKLQAVEDVSSACRTGRGDDDCNSFGRCCARHCQGPHDSACTEEEGRILASKCYCEGNSEDGEESIGERNVGLGDLHARPSEGTLSRRPSSSSTGSGSIHGRQDSIGGGSVHGRQDSIHSRQDSIGGRQDSVHGRESIGGIPGRQDSIRGSVHGRTDSVHSRESIGRGSIGSRHESIGGRHDSITSFTTISTVNAGNFGSVGDSASVCRARSRTCTEFTDCCNSHCRNPIRNSCTPGQLYYSICTCPGESLNLDSERPSSPGRVPGGSSIRDRPTATGADHTSSCKLTSSNDCLAFKRCCSTKCERKFSSRCSGDGGGRLMSAYCRCTSTTTTVFGRPGTIPDDFPRRESSHGGGFRDTDFPRRETGGAGGFHDHSQTCRDMASSGSCTSFRTCCDLRCRSSHNKDQSCTDRDGRIVTARCTCSG